MSKVLVDRVLLAKHVDEIDSWNASMERILGKQPSYKWQSLESLRDILAQPAEAEGDRPVAYLSGSYRDVIEGRTECVPLGAEVSFVDMGWMGQIELFVKPCAALSAVTAERDDLRLQVEALRAEREARDWEMKAQGIESVIHYVVSKHDQDLLRRHAADKRSEGKRIAAMDAKEE